MVIVLQQWRLLSKGSFSLIQQTIRRYSSTQVIEPSQNVVGPLATYSALVQNGSLKKDGVQEEVANSLDQLYNQLNTTESLNKKSLFGSLFRFARPNVNVNPDIKGLYLYGSVGCGKTMLMDLFYENVSNVKKKRVHFNEFMLDVHKRIHQIKLSRPPINRNDFKRNAKALDPIPPVAEYIANEIELLCFDEFQVTDVADALILKRLFENLFKQGVIMVATSNRKPEDLYKNGLQRVNFLPFIPMLKHYCDILHLSSNIDYRRLNLSDIKDCYYDSTDPQTTTHLNDLFHKLCATEEIAGYKREVRTLTILGRKLILERACGKALFCTFEELCMKPLGAVDYIEIGNTFDTVILENIPVMSAHRKVETRRFITLVDNFYDKKVRLICSADQPIEHLFVVSNTLGNQSDADRLLMDDLGISKNDSNSSASIFTAEEEIFAFERTKSRLTEMQTEQYWNDDEM